MKKLIAAIVLAVVLVGLALWLRKADTEEQADDTKATAQVVVATAKSESIARELEAYGTIEYSAQGLSLVSVSYDSVVRSVPVAVGSRVTKGSVLLLVDPSPDARLQFDSARSASALAERSLVASRQRYDLRLGTQDDLRTAQQGAEDARLKLESLKQRGISDGIRALVAPSDGVVLKLDATLGAVVAAGSPLASIANSDELAAIVGVETADAGSVRPGQKVVLSSVSRPTSVMVESSVGAVGAVTDPGTGTVEVRIPIAAGNGWNFGERVEARIELERKVALVVPSAAILSDGDQEVVYTVKAGKAVRHVVQAGIHSGDIVEMVRSDLAPGDSVVTQGNHELTDGMDVTLGDQPDKKASSAPEPEGKR